MGTGFLTKEQLMAHLVLGDIKLTQKEIMKARLGDGAIYSKIGDIYFNNKRDYFKAASWHNLGAEKKIANSQYRMGWMLQYGYGVIVNYKLAMSYYMKAQTKGNLMATNNIGNMYEKGLGVNRNFQMAFKWYLQAANKGLAISQCSIGRFYECGYSVQIDKTSALKWYQKSANQGSGEAQKAVYRLNKSGIFMTNKERYQHFENEKKKQESLVLSLRKQKVTLKNSIIAAEIAVQNAKKEARNSKFKSMFSFGF